MTAGYGIIVKDTALNQAISNYQREHNSGSKTAAAREMMKLYSIATPKEKERLANRLKWMNQRNKGFRTLPSVDPSLPKVKPKKKHPIASQPLPERKKPEQVNLR